MFTRILFHNATNGYFPMGIADDSFYNTKGGIKISQHMTVEKFNKSIIDFISIYERLPFIDEDEIYIKVTNNDIVEERPFKAGKYIKEYYKTKDRLVEYLFDNNLVTYKMIAEIYETTPTIIRNAITKKTAKPDIKVRRSIEMFFNKDYYKELGEYTDRCTKCKRKCKQFYWTRIFSCKNDTNLKSNKKNDKES